MRTIATMSTMTTIAVIFVLPCCARMIGSLGFGLKSSRFADRREVLARSLTSSHELGIHPSSTYRDACQAGTKLWCRLQAFRFSGSFLLLPENFDVLSVDGPIIHQQAPKQRQAAVVGVFQCCDCL